MVFNLYICYDSTTEMQDILKDMKNEYTEEKWEQGMYGGYSESELQMKFDCLTSFSINLKTA